MSDVYRNLKHHQTLALMYIELWAHNISLHRQIREMNHYPNNIHQLASTHVRLSICQAHVPCAEHTLTLLFLTMTL